MKFCKMHGLGNDYIYINNLDNSIDNPNLLASKLSDRHFGIGSDGLILICQSKVADFRMQMFNQDGSEAPMCGNGIRCVGKYVYDRGLTKKKILLIETKSGIKKLFLKLKNGKVSCVTVDMGEPLLKGEEIPIINYSLKRNNDNKEFAVVSINKQQYTCVSMGNPHAINFVKNVSDYDVLKVGKQVEIDSHFPKKTNVEFIEVIDRKTIMMRVWERGSGETLACGTGACASVISACLNNLTDKKVTVILLGGKLEIEWRDDNHVYMTGEATTVFDGEIDL